MAQLAEALAFIIADRSSPTAARRPELRPGESLRLKGFQQPVQSYTLAAA